MTNQTIKSACVWSRILITTLQFSVTPTSCDTHFKIVVNSSGQVTLDYLV